MTKPLIYLAGPITGTSYDNCVEWRENITDHYGHMFNFLSPMRGKKYLKDSYDIKDQYQEYVLSTQKAIFTRDMFDCNRCDAVFANLLQSQKASIGTIMELTVAWYRRIPSIVIMEDCNVHQHSMLKESCSWIVPSLDEGEHILCNLFSFS